MPVNVMGQSTVKIIFILLKSARTSFLDFDIKGGMGFQILFQTQVKRRKPRLSMPY
jgi:hypothetical protein